MIKSKKYQVTTSVSEDRCVMKVQNQSVLQRFFKLFSAFTLIFLLLLGASVEGAGQTTLTHFGLNNNLTPDIDNVNGTPSASQTGLNFSLNNSPCEGSHYLYCTGTGDYIDIIINTTGYYSISISWQQKNFSNSNGNWNLYGDYNNDGTFEHTDISTTNVTNSCATVSVSLPSLFNNQSNVRLRLYSNVSSGTYFYIDDITVSGITPGSTVITTYDYTGSIQTFDVPKCVTSLTVEAWGGGGGGYDGTNSGGGKGGGGGGYAKGSIANPSGTYNIVVGAGGVTGSNGSASTFGGTTVVADYGRGGTSPTNGGGTGGTSNTGNVTTSNGGDGGNGNNNSDGGGGGGGSGGPDGNGINGSNATNSVGGAGGAGDDGSGGAGGAGGNNSVGVAGTANALGGGGGGGGDNGTAGGAGGFPGAGGGGGENGGGAGANGQVKVTYTLPNNPTITLILPTASTCFSTTAQNVTFNFSTTSGCPDKYSITGSSFFNVTDANLTGSSFSVTVPANQAVGNYSGTLTVKNSTYGFVSDNISISVTVYAPPSAPSTAGAYICIGSTATLSASGATSGQVYKWYNASSGGSLLKTSTSNTDNTFSTPVLTATTNYWVAILNTSTGCESERTQITATFPSVSSDSQTRAGADTWIGHVYKRTDGSAGAPTDANAFTNYYGIITESEIFNESFGGTNFCLPLTANESTRSIYTEYFAVRYRMNSSKEGIYVAHMGSDDGVRLTVDGTKVYDRWIERGYTVDTVVLIKLSGTSNLLLEYYESAGGNQISFQNLSKVSNNLTSGTTQTICSSSTGSQISGNNVFTDPPIGSRAIFTVSYQWQQSTDQNIWSDISGATSQNYTPSGFLEGTYYIRRKLTVSRTNPGSIVVSAIDYSNIATLTVRPVFTAGTIANTGQTICSGTVPTTQIGSTADAGGGDNTITYQWQYSTDNTFSTGVSTVASNTATYIPTQALTQTTYYRRQAKDGTCNTMFTSSSGVWSVTVNPLPTANISGDNSPLCAGDDAVFNLTGTAGAVVTFKVNSGSEQTITLTEGVATLTINNVNSDQVLTLVSVTNGTCSQSLNTTSTITVNPIPEIGSFN